MLLTTTSSKRGRTLLLAICTTTACSSGAASQRATLDRSFRCIEVHEARIEHGRAELAAAATSCDDACEAAADARAHDTRLCELARETSDRDALARCELAERNTLAIVARARERCSCER